MALFGRKQQSQTPPAPAQVLQPPDEFLLEGQGYYAQAQFAQALESYRKSIDKLHTMYTFPAPSSRLRRPGPADQPTIDGFVSSIGAAYASGQGSLADPAAEQATAYLLQIAQCFSNEGNSEASRYEKGVYDIQAAVTRGKG